jgi:conjugal transfer pilus assembly protein TraU
MLIKNKRNIAAVLTACCLLVVATNSYARCGGSFLNPVTDVAWNNIFPVKIAGISLGSNSNGMVEPPDPAGSAVCICPAPPPIFQRIGISIAFWEPARMAEVVSQAWCMPSIGTSMGSLGGGELGGAESTMGNNDDALTFGQVHYFYFAPWALMNLLTDLACVETTGFDLAYMTELDPLWNDDELSFIIQPEALVFANPVAQLSCVADSSTVNLTGLPVNALPHCVGSGGSVYPLSGNVGDDDIVQASQTMAARMVYKLGRQGLLMDPAINLCMAVPTPIWNKWNYRFQQAKPVRSSIAQPPGRSTLIWGAGKNPPIGADATDNFLSIVFRKRACCAF